jgi:prepilin-type N-terminal cleavage/methylation domain-containing protein/prepilin-type processing-associated H-X9-DG protein
MNAIRKPQHGFTLVELLVVITIIGILIALLLPAVQAAREAARRAQCSNGLKQLTLAMMNYESTVGCLPPGALNTSFPTGRPRTSWMIHLYPYLEQQAAYDSYHFNLPAGPGDALWTNPTNSMGVNPPTALVIPMLLCPSDGQGGTLHHMAGIGTYARGNYAGFLGNIDYGSAQPPAAAPHKRAAFGLNVVVRIADIRDGTSNTMAFGEVLTGTNSDDDFRGVHWYDHAACSQVFTKFPPNTPNPDVFHPMWCGAGMSQPAMNLPCTPGSSDNRIDTAASRSRHPGGVQVGLCDGSVQFASESIDLNVWQAMGSIDGGEPIGQLP